MAPKKERLSDTWFAKVDGDDCALEWVWPTQNASALTTPTKNGNGTTGWAKIVGRSSGPLRPDDGDCVKYHRCLSPMCIVEWGANKYDFTRGDVMPKHVAPSDWRPRASAQGHAPSQASGLPEPSAAPEAAAEPQPEPAAAVAAIPAEPDAAPAALPALVPEAEVATATPKETIDQVGSGVGEGPLEETFGACEAGGPAMNNLEGEPGSVGAPEDSMLLGAAVGDLLVDPASSNADAVAVALGEPPQGAPLKFWEAAEPFPEEYAAPVGKPTSAAEAGSTTAPSIDLTEDAVPQEAQGAAVAVDQGAGEGATRKLLELSRQIRTDRTYIGHSAFILMALLKGVRPYVWEGDSRVDLLEAYAPWALERCTTAVAVDGVCVCSAEEGVWAPVDTKNPLHKCRHFMAAAYVEASLGASENALEQFYQSMGVVLLGTVVDGDCGIDVMCNMLNLSPTLCSRSRLRQDTGRGNRIYMLYKK